MCRKAYRVGDHYYESTAEWLSPYIKSFKGDKYHLKEAILTNGQKASYGDYIVCENNEASVVTFEQAQKMLQQCRCITCEYGVQNIHPRHDWSSPVCLAGGTPDSWKDHCNILRHGPDNQLDRVYKKRSTTLAHIQDMAEWDADYYAEQVLGKTAEEIDATGDEDCIHAWVTKDLLQKQRCALIPYEIQLIQLAKKAVKRFSEVGATLHAKNIDEEAASMQRDLAYLLATAPPEEQTQEGTE